MSKLKNLWQYARKYVLAIIIAIVLYEALENIDNVIAAFKKVMGILSPLITGLCVAFVVNMPMSFIERHAPKRLRVDAWSKRLRVGSMAAAYLLAAALLFLFVLMVVPSLTESIKSLVENLDTYVEQASGWFDGIWRNLQVNDAVTERLQQLGKLLFEWMDALLTGVVSGALNFTIGLVTGVFNTLIAVMLSIFALYNKEKLLRQTRKMLYAVLKPERAERYEKIAARSNLVFHKYILGQFLDCFILGVLCFIGMKVFSMPYAVLISVIIGVTQLVPIVGPWIGTVPSAFIILMVNPVQAIWFVVFILILQQLEGNLIYPRVVGNAVGLSGLWVLIAIIVGGGFFGLVGILFSVPIMAVLYTIVSDWVNTRLRKKEINALSE